MKIHETERKEDVDGKEGSISVRKGENIYSGEVVTKGLKIQIGSGEEIGSVNVIEGEEIHRRGESTEWDTEFESYRFSFELKDRVWTRSRTETVNLFTTLLDRPTSSVVGTSVVTKSRCE